MKNNNKIFEKDKPYPKWDPDNPDETPGIPNWKRNFGKIIIEFDKGSRTCYFYKQKYGKDVECGDYVIKIEKQITDKEAWKKLVDCLDSKDIDNFYTIYTKYLI